jgi:hypothetical protein
MSTPNWHHGKDWNGRHVMFAYNPACLRLQKKGGGLPNPAWDFVGDEGVKAACNNCVLINRHELNPNADVVNVYCCNGHA